jgi:hypothetical protein
MRLVLLNFLLMTFFGQATWCQASGNDATTPGLQYQVKDKSICERYLSTVERHDPERGATSWRSRLYEIYRLLQETFYPSVQSLEKEIHEVTTAEILDSDKRLQKLYPLHESSYSIYQLPFDEEEGGYTNKMPFPVVDPQNESSDFKRSLNAVIFDNIHNGYFSLLWWLRLERSERFVWSEPNWERANEFGKTQFQESLVITPVGEYGSEFAKRLARTTKIIMDIASRSEHLRKISGEAYDKASELIANETARGKGAAAEMGQQHLRPLSVTLEGILSLHQLFATFLSKRVPGAETGDQALHDFIFQSEDSGLVSEITTRLPMGVIGPATMAGLHFPNPIERNSNGKLVLSEKVIDALRNIPEPPSGRKKSRCPLAGLWHKGDQKTGLQSLAEAYWKVFLLTK